MNNLSRIIAIALLVFVAPGALYAGYSFIADPSGAGMGMNTLYLIHSPFKNFLIPGIVLFIVNGICNMIAAIAAVKKIKSYPWFIIVQGIMLAGWIIVQVLIVRDIEALHILFLSIGIILIKTGISINTKQQ